MDPKKPLVKPAKMNLYQPIESRWVAAWRGTCEEFGSFGRLVFLLALSLLMGVTVFLIRSQGG